MKTEWVLKAKPVLVGVLLMTDIVFGIVLSSWIAGILGVIVIVLIEMRIDQEVQRNIDATADRSRLAITQSDLFRTLGESIVELNAKGADHDRFRTLLDKRLAGVVVSAQMCCVGRIEVPRSEYEVMFASVEKAQASVEAVTSFRDLDWWESPVGQSFAEIQRGLLTNRQNLRINRVFIAAGDHLTDSESAILKRLEFEGRAAVSWLPHRVVLDMGLDVNVTIVDQLFVHEDLDIDTIEVRHLYRINKSDIDRCRARFSELSLRAHPFS